MRPTVPALLLAALLGAMALAPPALATPIPEEVYEVVATHPLWGPGIGYLWGHPTGGARLWLATAAGYAEFGFTIGGSQSEHATTAGTLVLDRWTGPDNDRFVGGFFREDGPDPEIRAAANLTAFGGGKLNGFAIEVVGHS